jgi:hypothetical protein
VRLMDIMIELFKNQKLVFKETGLNGLEKLDDLLKMM